MLEHIYANKEICKEMQNIFTTSYCLMYLNRVLGNIEEERRGATSFYNVLQFTWFYLVQIERMSERAASYLTIADGDTNGAALLPLPCFRELKF